jgi:hypothetical protein
MKIKHLALFAVLCCGAIGICAEPDDFRFARTATDLKRLTRITPSPHEMAASSVTSCRAPSIGPHNLHEGDILESAWCNVYVTADAKEIMLSGTGAYPVGTLVVKSKLATKDANEVLLYTVMQKMPQGYDPDNGDWEYSVIDGKTRRVQARGRIDSCIECHKAYPDSDYVSRVYLKKTDE